MNHKKACVVCQAYNNDRQKRPEHLYPTSPPEGPNQLISIDFSGPFLPTPQNSRYVLCLTDYFTKFVTALPLPNCLAATTAAAIFKDCICRYGVPKSLITDQGTSFRNHLMSKLSKLIGRITYFAHHVTQCLMDRWGDLMRHSLLKWLN